MDDKTNGKSVADKKNLLDESFRDTIGTVDAKGDRNWIFPKKPKGKLTNYRQYTSYLLLAIFFIWPFLKVNGRPFLLLDIIDRKFIIFGNIFWPQDMHIFFFVMLAGMLFIVLFTVAFGRLFCGWVCPQTIFMEHVFRRIEYLIEGDYKKQEKLTKMPWNGEKIRKRGLKIVIFFGISFLISNTFLAYIIGIDELEQYITHPTESYSTLLALLLFTLVFYFVFAWFREQVCIAVCPYGRLQGVMLDRNSIVVAYDYVRGEKRGHKKRNEERTKVGKGDCVDCNLCVAVCPTGIDIRNGTQLECINCTACIDACDEVMEKVKSPKGLIRYASESQIADNRPFIYSTRLRAYTGVLTLLLLFISFLLFSRTDLEATILRAPGMLSQKRADGTISNLYTLKMVNKSPNEMYVYLRLIGRDGEIQMVGGDSIRLVPQGRAEGAFFVIFNPDDLDKVRNNIKFELYSAEGVVEKVGSTFLKN